MKSYFAALFILISTYSFSQNIKHQEVQSHSVQYCDEEINERFLDANPHLKEGAEAANQQLEEAFRQMVSGKVKRSSNQRYVVSVVFHVVHGNGPENISDDQIHDAMRILNRDFQKENPDTVDVVPAFENMIGEPNIEFRLALKDDNGNPTNGIVRYYDPAGTSSGGEGTKTGRWWDRSKYLNIWVVEDITSGAAGYTYRPGTVNNSQARLADGIIVRHNYVGSIGTGSEGRSRTLTHEVGHWINLPHPWGSSNTPGLSSNCSIDDGVDDTPLTIGLTTCNLSANSCTGDNGYWGFNQIDNTQNYMDYSYCTMMFTPQQSERMRVALESPIAQRSTLWQTSTLDATGVNQLLAADFSAGENIFCWGEEVHFIDRSLYGQDTWKWNFPNSNVGTSATQNPRVIFTQSGIKDVSLVVSNGPTTLSKTKKVWALPAVGFPVPYGNSFESATNFMEDVFVINTDEDSITFRKTDKAAFDGRTSLMLKNSFSSEDNSDEVIVGPVDVTPFESFSLTWRYAFAQRASGNDDKLLVYTSIDCGKTWRLKYQKSGSGIATAPATFSQFFPSSASGWDIDAINSFNATEKNAETLLIKFQFQNKGGNNFFLDDIKVEGQYKNEPVLEYPRKGAVNVAANPTINWKAVGGATTYEYQVDVHTDFNTSSLISGSTTALGLDPNNTDTEIQLSGLTNSERYFWRVRAITNGTPSDWSEVWDFTVSANGVNVVELNERNAINIYPNPAKNQVNISFEELIEDGKIELLDLTGKVIETEIIQNKVTTLNLNNVAKGLYLIKVSSAETQTIRKLQIN